MCGYINKSELLGITLSVRLFFCLGISFVLPFRVAASGEGEKIVLDPMVIFHQAVENVKPSVATQSVKKGGKSYHVSIGGVKK